MKVFDKLVRDKIPEYLQQIGKNPHTHIATDQEYWKELKAKLREETEEFLESEQEEEIVDIQEVIDAILSYKKIDPKHLRMLKRDKAKKRGKFAKRIILESV